MRFAHARAEGQLRRYREHVEREMPGWQIIGVYLTLEGDDPSDEGAEAGFVPWSHDQVLQLIEQIGNRLQSISFSATSADAFPLPPPEARPRGR